MKNSRKTEKIILAVAAVAALGAVVLWWFVDGETWRQRTVASPPSMPSPASVSARTQDVAKPASPLAIAPTPTPTPTPAPPVMEQHESSLAPADPPQAAPATRADTPPAVTARAQADSSGSAVQSPPAESAAAADATPESVASIEGAGGHDEAIDLFAERLTTLEQDAGDDPADANDARLLHEFKARADDEVSSSQRVQVLHDHVDAWFASFPVERADHLNLVSVECRAGACQLLIAEDTTEFSESPGDTFGSSFRALVSEDWCRQLGLSLQSITMHASGSGADGKSDHTLWTIYLGDTASG